MRIIVMFDLPIQTGQQKKNYRIFRKNLLANGFVMEQYSVYTKLVMNKSVAQSVYRKIEMVIPASGLVQMLTVTEKQYSDMVYLKGARQTDVIDTTERLVIL